ncbi:hypothetical protein PCM06_08640 [Staphylococcus aureus]|nr:hypothetical protein PCM06_08640 [Staphylococcus aureus]
MIMLFSLLILIKTTHLITFIFKQLLFILVLHLLWWEGKTSCFF